MNRQLTMLPSESILGLCICPSSSKKQDEGLACLSPGGQAGWPATLRWKLMLQPVVGFLLQGNLSLAPKAFPLMGGGIARPLRTVDLKLTPGVE